MKQQLFIYEIIAMVGILSLCANPVLAADTMMYETEFAPYFVGRHQRDNLIVVNRYGRDRPYSLMVEATAYDPFSGEQLDVQRAEIREGEGARIVITDTYPIPHASQLVVKVEVIPDGLGAFAGEDVMPDPPFNITRILTTRQDATVLQVVGDPKPQIVE